MSVTVNQVIAPGEAVILDANSKLPALDGSQLTSISPTVIQATVDFGFPTGPIEGDTASVTVNNSSVGATSKFVCTVQGGTADHDVEDAVCEGIVAYVTTVTNGVSYVVTAYAPEGSWGRYFVNVIVA